MAYAQAYYMTRAGSGHDKKRLAIETAKSLAPKPAKKVDEHLPVLVDATYARMKASLPNPSFHSTSGADIPVDVVATGPLGERPTPLPPLKGKLS